MIVLDDGKYEPPRSMTNSLIYSESRDISTYFSINSNHFIHIWISDYGSRKKLTLIISKIEKISNFCFIVFPTVFTKPTSQKASTMVLLDNRRHEPLITTVVVDYLRFLSKIFNFPPFFVSTFISFVLGKLKTTVPCIQTIITIRNTLSGEIKEQFSTETSVNNTHPRFWWRPPGSSSSNANNMKCTRAMSNLITFPEFSDIPTYFWL